eukprot:PhM_4_TR8842/c0_g1_i2/m.56032
MNSTAANTTTTTTPPSSYLSPSPIHRQPPRGGAARHIASPSVSRVAFTPPPSSTLMLSSTGSKTNPYSAHVVAVKRLPSKALAESVKRLSAPPPRAPTPVTTIDDMQRPVRRLSAKEQRAAVHRMYDEAIKHKHNQTEKLLGSVGHIGPATTIKADDADVERTVHRLYAEAVMTRGHMHDTLCQKHLAPLPKKGDAESEAAARHSVQSLYYGQKERDSLREQKLRAKYVDGVLPSVRPRSAVQWDETVTRLYTK